MTTVEDLKLRFKKQLEYHDNRARKYFYRYTILKMGEIVAASAIPIMALVASSQIPGALLGSLIAVIEGYLNVNKTHERWIAHRKAAESLRIEGMMWETESGRYGQTDAKDQMFAEQLVSVLQQGQSEWLAVFSKAEKGKEDDA